jgi:hypothetical protein
MASSHPPERQQSSSERPEPPHGLRGVSRTGRLVATVPAEKRRNESAIDPQQGKHSSSCRTHRDLIFRATRSIPWERLSTNNWKSTDATSGVARTTNSNPSCGSTALNASRSRRRIRLRRTAVIPRAPTARPNRAGVSGSPRAPYTVTRPPLQRRPSAATRPNSVRPLSDRRPDMARSGREARSALGAPTLQDRPARTGAHARTKPMPTFPTPDIWLEGSLGHRAPPCPKSSPTVYKLWSRNGRGVIEMPAQYRRTPFLHVTGCFEGSPRRPR